MRAIPCRSALQVVGAILLGLSRCEAASPAIAEPEATTPQEVFDGMQGSFRPDMARDVHARYQFDLSGPLGGQWWIEVNAGKFRIGHGLIDHPDVTFVSSDRDWVALSNGTLSGTWATLTGRLKVHGDRRLARKLDEMCP